eukprot:scaffold228_cov312-Pinguiococcus_pyrenoidosus.AAC.46
MAGLVMWTGLLLPLLMLWSTQPYKQMPLPMATPAGEQETTPTLAHAAREVLPRWGLVWYEPGERRTSRVRLARQRRCIPCRSADGAPTKSCAFSRRLTLQNACSGFRPRRQRRIFPSATSFRRHQERRAAPHCRGKHAPLLREVSNPPNPPFICTIHRSRNNVLAFAAAPGRGSKLFATRVPEMPRASEPPEKPLESDAAFAILDQMIQRSGPQLIQKLGATVQFNVTAKSCNQVQRGWVLDLSGKKGASAQLRQGFEATADLHMVAPDAVMVDIAYGRLNPKMAFLSGKLRMTPVSRVGLAVRFDSLIQVRRDESLIAVGVVFTDDGVLGWASQEWREELLGYTKLYKGSLPRMLKRGCFFSAVCACPAIASRVTEASLRLAFAHRSGLEVSHQLLQEVHTKQLLYDNWIVDDCHGLSPTRRPRFSPLVLGVSSRYPFVVDQRGKLRQKPRQKEVHQRGSGDKLAQEAAREDTAPLERTRLHRAARRQRQSARSADHIAPGKSATRQGKARQGKARQGKARQGKAEFFDDNRKILGIVERLTEKGWTPATVPSVPSEAM